MAARSPSESHKSSRNTRNPHVDFEKIEKVSLSDCSSEEELIFRQWLAAEGRPISDFAASKYEVVFSGRNFTLSDVRIWGSKKYQPTPGTQKIKLEFFFDGFFEFKNEAHKTLFISAFERMLEHNLQEGRREEFRSKLKERKRRNGNEGGGDEIEMGDASSWKDYLQGDLPEIQLEVDSFREGGCMLQFVVARTTISAQAARLLGQQAFPDAFEDAPEFYKLHAQSKMPMWVYVMQGTGLIFVMIVLLFFVRAMSDHM